MDSLPLTFGEPAGDDEVRAAPAAPQCTQILGQEALANLDDDEEYLGSQVSPSADGASALYRAAVDASGALLDVSRLPPGSSGPGRKSALASGTSSHRKTVTMTGFAEEVSHRLEVAAVPLNDASDRQGFDPQFAGSLQHKLMSTAPGAAAPRGSQLQAALDRMMDTEEAPDGLTGEEWAIMSPPPTRATVSRASNASGVSLDGGLPRGDPLEEVPVPPVPPSSRKSTDMTGGTAAAEAEAEAEDAQHESAVWQSQLVNLQQHVDHGFVPAAGEPVADLEQLSAGTRAPHATTKLDPSMLDDLDDEIPTLLNDSAVVTSGNLDLGFAAQLQMSLQHQPEQEEYPDAAGLPREEGAVEGLDGDDYEPPLGAVPQGSQAPKCTVQLDSDMLDGLEDDDEAPMETAISTGVMTGLLQQQMAANQKAAGGAPRSGDLQQQWPASLQPEAAPIEDLKDALISGDLETALKRKLAVEQEADADENLDEADGVRAPQCTMLLSDAMLNGLDEDDMQQLFAKLPAAEPLPPAMPLPPAEPLPALAPFTDAGLPPLPQPLEAALIEAKAAPPELGDQVLMAERHATWQLRLSGLSKECICAENAALRAEVEALRLALRRRRSELSVNK